MKKSFKEVRKSMLSKYRIAEEKGIESNICQGCGIENIIHRCHIKACVDGGGNEIENMLLLCPFCHLYIQEEFTYIDEDINFIKELFDEKHMPFFNVKMNHYISKYNNDLLSKNFFNNLNKKYIHINKINELPYFRSKLIEYESDLFKSLNNGKIDIFINDITKLGGNLNDILNTLQYFIDKKVNIHIENLGLTTLLSNTKINPTVKLMINLMDFIGEYERESIKERTQKGREVAKARKAYKGRKRGSNANMNEYKLKYKNDIEKVQELINNNNNISSIAMIAEIPRTRIYRFIEKGLVINNK